MSNQGFYQGDDLVNIITINRPLYTDDLTITKAELQVGCLTFVNENPTFPYSVSILRNQSVELSCSNPVYLRISYLAPNGVTNYRTTCLGTLTLNVNKQVVKDTY